MKLEEESTSGHCDMILVVWLKEKSISGQFDMVLVMWL